MAAAVGSLRSVPKRLSPLPISAELHTSFVRAFLPLPFRASRFSCPRKSPFVIHGKKRSSQLEPVQKISSTQGDDEEEEDISTQGDGEDFENGAFVEDDFEDVFEDDFGDEFEDVFEEEEEDDLELFVSWTCTLMTIEQSEEICVGDGSGGGRILLAGTWWDKKALAMAEELSQSLDGDFRIYSFKTSTAATIHMRIEKLSNKYGSPTVNDIEVFSAAYRARLDEGEVAGAIPDNISLENATVSGLFVCWVELLRIIHFAYGLSMMGCLEDRGLCPFQRFDHHARILIFELEEVSSPGVERLIRVPQDLDRFKDLPMYVRYVIDMAAAGPPKENDGVFKLVSLDLESGCCTWSLADVRINREQKGKGKGRPLSKKQREWRLQLPFESLRLVRLHSEF
ncbi:hypothetical protein ACLOJK_016717 [Asimina triloba]